jgi:hypothetical protein
VLSGEAGFIACLERALVGLPRNRTELRKIVESGAHFFAKIRWLKHGSRAARELVAGATLPQPPANPPTQTSGTFAKSSF